MSVSISRLRAWFGLAVLVVVVIVAGFYLYGRMALRRGAAEMPKNLDLQIQQSTEGFSLSKSEAGRTLFTVRAEKATQYKQGGRAELHNVLIVIYGRDSNRFDQIYGNDFEYDPASGNVTAKGVVHLDLQANNAGATSPDQAPPQELKNPVHITTRGLIFNQKTGDARSNERVEFSLPQTSGYADGIAYDSKLNQLVLLGNVHLTTNEANATNVVAERAVISKQTRSIILSQARIERQNSTIHAGQLTAFLRDDNTVDRLLATSGVQSDSRGPTVFTVQAPEALLYLQGKSNDLRLLTTRGGSTFQTSGASPMTGSAETLTADFGPHNLIQEVHTAGNVKLTQPPRPGNREHAPGSGVASSGQTVELTADIVDFSVAGGHHIQRAETSKHAQITLTPVTPSPNDPASAAERTVVTAAKFYAAFDHQNRLTSLTGYPAAKVVSYTSGKPERLSTSRVIDVGFNTNGEVNRVVQRDGFQYHESLPNGSERAARAETATYSPETDLLTLSGKPRVVEGGMTTTATTIQLDRRSGDASAEGEVKSTYTEPRPPLSLATAQHSETPAGSDPIHVTARSMTAQRATGLARYVGGARLWQGANIIQAATIDFDRDRRMIIARAQPVNGQTSPPRPADANQFVSTMLVQQDRGGKLKPTTITSKLLAYDDRERVAHFSGKVSVRNSDGNLTAGKADVYLRPAQPGAGTRSALALTASRENDLDHIVAEGNVHLRQPTRDARGEKLVYTASEDSYVLTGGWSSIFDAERGTIHGSALTFYNRDDRVVVEGKGINRTTTNTRVFK